MNADHHRSSYSLSPRVVLKLRALAERSGLTPTRWLEMFVERQAFEAGITVTNADVILYHAGLQEEDQHAGR